jgi:hypothetical protein
MFAIVIILRFVVFVVDAGNVLLDAAAAAVIDGLLIDLTETGVIDCAAAAGAG